LSRPDPVEHCDVCRWIVVCKRWWRETDHLSLVAGITRNQRRSLVEVGVETRRALAGWPMPVPRLARTSRDALERVREQARIQVDGETSGRHLYEVLEPERLEDGPLLPGRGLSALPPPSPGDLFFDIEGDPFAFDEGLEYLWGVIEPGATDERGQPTYHATWALDKAAEKLAFESFVDFVWQRRQADPNLHVYHYGSYERGRVARLSTRHATREEQVDVLLRSGTFVDLFNVVRQGVRASVESYSIKRLEPLYDFRREVDLQEAGESIVEFERYLEEGASDQSILAKIADYNRDDCLSAWRLRDWLEARRPEAEAQFRLSLPRPTADEGETSAEKSAARLEVQQLAERLTGGLPPPEQRSPEDHARQLLADLLDWHWREEKSMWWRFFDLLSRPDDELLEEREPLAGLEFMEEIPPSGRQSNARYRYSFPPQENELKPGVGVHDPRLYRAESGSSVGTVEEIDQAAGIVVLSRKPGLTYHPTALVPLDNYQTNAQRRALLEIGRFVADNGLRAAGPYRAARDMLLRASPRVGQAGGGSLPDEETGAPLTQPGETGSAAALRLVLSLDESTLPIQGPPGSGKSTTGAEMILRLVDAGRRVGITANSHKVISNLLRKVVERSIARGRPIRAVQRAGRDEQGLDHDLVDVVAKNEAVADALNESSAMIAAGTAWLWSDEDLRNAVDVLFVDEAGQLSLANALAVSVGARSLVLLGDPQQLDQPTQGAHPGDAGRSALEHILGAEQTIDPRRGLFLEHTWRLHPQITDFTSQLFYRGLLEAQPGLERQRVDAPFDGAGLFAAEQPLDGSGLRFLPVEHVGNTSRSDEEADAVAALAKQLVSGTTGWTDSAGERRPLGWDELLIVAPYNAQVRAIRDRLPAEGRQRVGTVDKFQGQEAAVAIYSLTTSSLDEAPHGMEFLYSLNRLNVATSRARCLAVVVASPALLRARCRTPGQLRLANGLCAFVEMAAQVTPPQIPRAPAVLAPR
jgi:uncharacterized protein